MNSDVTKIRVFLDPNTDDEYYARCTLTDGQERDVPLECDIEDAEAVRENTEFDHLVGDVGNCVPVISVNGEVNEGNPDRYVWVVDDGIWGDEVLADGELAAACERAEAWLTEHEGPHLSISVESTGHRGDAAAIYKLRPNGDRQILGYSLEVPETVERLISDAREYACDTWPEVN